MLFNFDKKTGLKALVLILELLTVGMIIYLVFLPFYPLAKYALYQKYSSRLGSKSNLETAQNQVSTFKNSLAQSDYAVSPNRLIISKIGVNAPIVESKNSDYGLSKGSWLVPNTSTPDKGGNTVITGHRFKYLPPNNLTFFLLDKLKKDDIISVIWQEKNYFYRVSRTRIVPATEISILEKTVKPTLTLYTCDPIYSTKNRLVIISELIEN